MRLFDRGGWIPGWPKARGHVIGKHRAELRSFAGVAPGHFWAGAMVLEVIQPEAKARASIGADDAAELIQVGRLTIGSKAHDFVFVTELAKSEVLRNGGVIHAERMRESDRA